MALYAGTGVYADSGEIPGTALYATAEDPPGTISDVIMEFGIPFTPWRIAPSFS